jgi:hypothetical protein
MTCNDCVADSVNMSSNTLATAAASQLTILWEVVSHEDDTQAPHHDKSPSNPEAHAFIQADCWHKAGASPQGDRSEFVGFGVLQHLLCQAIAVQLLTA